MTAREYMAYSRQRSDNIKAIIAEHKQRKGMTRCDGSQGGRHQSGTFVQRKRNPGTFRLNDLWAICNVLDVPEEQKNNVLDRRESCKQNQLSISPQWRAL